MAKKGKSDEFDEFDEFEDEFEEKVEVPKKRPKKAVKVAEKVPSGLRKRGRKPMNPRDKFTKSVLRKSKIEALPELDSLFFSRVGDVSKVKIGDVGVFLGTPEDDLLAELAQEWDARNQVNLSSEVGLAGVKKVGVAILEDGKVSSAIEVARVVDNGNALECTSGRHRLAFLALMYGLDVEVPVDLREMTLMEARNAVIRANESRKIQGLEKSEHAILRATGGNIDIDRDELYEKVVISKSKAIEYSAYSVIDQELHGGKLDFDVSLTNRSGDALTTVNGIKSFWRSAMKWDSKKTRTEFDNELKKSVQFLNGVVAAMTKLFDFKPDQHLATMTLSAIGKLYDNLVTEAEFASNDLAGLIAEKVVACGDIGRQKSEKTFQSIVRSVKRAARKSSEDDVEDGVEVETA